MGNPYDRYGELVTPSQVPTTTKLNMLYDPILQMAVSLTESILVKAKRIVHCEDPEKKAFFEAMLRGANGWEETFMLQANMAIALGSLGLVKKWRFEEPRGANGAKVWKGKTTPYIITGFDQCYPLDSEPKFDDTGRTFEGISTIDGDVDRFYSLWLTIGLQKAFGDYMGFGRLNAAYNDWWTKQLVRDSYLVSIQRHASPPVKVTHPEGKDGSGTDYQTRALQAGDAVQGGATIAIPSTLYMSEDPDSGAETLTSSKMWDLTFEQAGDPITKFPELEDHHNRMIALAYLLPPQAVMDVTGGDLGGPTSSDKLLNLAAELIMADASAIDGHLNKYVLQDVSDANFPPGSAPVKIETVGLSEASVAHLFEFLKILLPEDPSLFSVPDALKQLNMPIDEEAAAKTKEERVPKKEPPPKPETIEKEAQPEKPTAAIAGSAVNQETGKVEPDGEPLEAQGDDPVGISAEDVEKSILLWEKNAPKAASGLLLAEPYAVGMMGGDRMDAIRYALALGGPGSGNWAHKGREGLRGGSAKRDSGLRFENRVALSGYNVVLLEKLEYLALQAGEHTGIVVMVMTPKKVADAIAADFAHLEDVENVEDMHVTLAYFGDVGDGKIDPDKLKNAIAGWAASQKPIKAKLNGVGRFDIGGNATAFHALVDSPEFPQLRETMIQAIKDGGIPFEPNHGFTAHNTIAYLDRDVKDPGLLNKAKDMAFDVGEVVVGFGDDRTVYRLGGEISADGGDPIVGGGPGSGNWGHKGRAGLKGGSAKRDGGASLSEGKQASLRVSKARLQYTALRKKAKTLSEKVESLYLQQIKDVGEARAPFDEFRQTVTDQSNYAAGLQRAMFEAEPGEEHDRLSELYEKEQAKADEMQAEMMKRATVLNERIEEIQAPFKAAQKELRENGVLLNEAEDAYKNGAKADAEEALRYYEDEAARLRPKIAKLSGIQKQLEEESMANFKEKMQARRDARRIEDPEERARALEIAEAELQAAMGTEKIGTKAQIRALLSPEKHLAGENIELDGIVPKDPHSSHDVGEKWKEGVDEFTNLVGKNPLYESETVEYGHMERIMMIDDGRAFEQGGNVYLSSSSYAKAVIHELGHTLEAKDPLIHSMTSDFRRSRIQGERAEQLRTVTGKAYGESEYTYKDDFIDPYMGKNYNGGQTEILSMGLELFYTNPVKFAREDPEMFDFIYAVVRVGL